MLDPLARQYEEFIAAGVERGLPALFERLAAAHGERPAIGSGPWQPSYLELNRAANRLAHRLLARGGCPGDMVAVLAHHNGPLIAAMLAGLKAGRIVAVLYPTNPPARLAKLYDDADATALIADATYRSLAESVVPAEAVVMIEQERDGPEHDPGIRVSADATAFLIYTSGTTGEAKGVMQTHRLVARNAMRLAGTLELQARDRVALLAALGSGQGMVVAWSTFASGAALCPYATAECGAAGLPSWLAKERISIYISSVSLFRHVVGSLKDTTLPSVRAVRVGSESATATDFDAFRRHFPNAKTFLHTLSSSETGNIAALSLGRDDAVAPGRLPVGRPLDADIEVFLVGEDGREVAPGEPGEIVVRSKYLAAGYWRNPSLTAARFERSQDGVSSFRSGDIGRLTREGMLEFLGRTDARIKIRGYRIERSEVEEVLLKLPGVARAVVDTRERTGYEPRLVAYLVGGEGAGPSARSLRQALATQLPSHMIPSGFVFLDTLPLTPHGKVDREALRQVDLPAPAQDEVERPRTESEARLATIWAEALDISGIGSSDDFFELGGDSLIAAVVSAEVQTAFGVDLEPGAFMEYPTLVALAGAIDAIRCMRGNRRVPPLARVPRDRPLPMSFSQERTWRYSQTPQASVGYYTTARAYSITGPLDVSLLHDCMNYLAGRHEMLRTTFHDVDGQPRQIVQPPALVDLPVLDLSGAAKPEVEAERIFRNEAARAFDLATLPLVRFALLRIGDNRYRLLRVSHHILSDGWSWQLYFRELALLYDAGRQGRRPPLPSSEELQYADYAVWQRATLCPKGQAYQETVSWWRERLADPPQPIELSFKRATPLLDVDAAEGAIHWSADAETARRLDILGRGQSTTPYTIYLAASAALLAHEGNAVDFVIGTYVTHRRRTELQHMFGFFSNLATLRFTFWPELPFLQWLSVVRVCVADAEAHSEIPYEELRVALESYGVTIPDIRIIISPRTNQSLRFADLELTWLEKTREAMPWGFSVGIDTAGHEGIAAFDAGLYDPAGVRAMLARYVRLLDVAARRPDLSVGELLAMSESG